MAAILKLQVRITKYLMCMYGGTYVHVYIKMKFLCLTLCQGQVHTDDDADTNDAGCQ